MLGGGQNARQHVWFYIVFGAFSFTFLGLIRFLYHKCDTRTQMSIMLTKTTKILQRNNIEYWLDKGTLLGVFRDNGLIPWEYDVDLGVMNRTCNEISKLKEEFKQVGLTAYDRSDFIPHKVKITYDTEHHHFYWSDPYLHDPCIRVYDTNDLSTWVDIYWYVEYTAEDVLKDPSQFLIPPRYDYKDHLICCSEGLRKHTHQMCCGGCIPKTSLFPLSKQMVSVTDGISMSQSQFVPNAIVPFLSIQYGEKALRNRKIKGWKGVVCGFWTSPMLFMFHLMILNIVLVLLVFVMKSKFSITKRKNKRDM
jgi:hypothetical protein